MMDLSFLQDVEVEAVVKTATKERTVIVRLPEDSEADIRVFSNGGIYPSKAYAEANGLEFGSRLEVADKPGKFETVGNGLDIFPSTKWGAVMGKLPQELVFVTVVAKAESKVDVWASTKYNEDNTPKASVFTQGASTFSKETLLPMLTEIYSVNWDTTAHVDLKVMVGNRMASPNGVYQLPKIVSSGKFKGEDTYVRRENIDIFPLVVVHEEPKPVKEVAEPTEAEKAFSAKPTNPGAEEVPLEADAQNIADKEEADSTWDLSGGGDQKAAE